MKITRVEIFDADSCLCDAIPEWHPVIVRIHTDEGISGVGEAGIAYGTGHTAAAGMVKNLAQDFLINADPMKSESIWQDMFSKTFWAKGGGPIVFSGMSAIDTALWDIKGKALNVPVYQLLGGKTNDNLRTYASQIQIGWADKYETMVEPEQFAEAALKAVSQGYDCVKVDPVVADSSGEKKVNRSGVLRKKQIDLFYDRVKAIREAVGEDVDIIIELHSYTDATSAVQLGRRLEELNCMYYEEPVHYLNPKLQAKVSKNVKIPMAAGERIYTRWGYQPYFENQLLELIQPDLGLVGGITEGKKICDYAQVYDIGVQAHVCGTPVATAAALQLEAAIPNFAIHEHHVFSIMKANTQLCNVDLQPVNGGFKVPDSPGLGIELEESAIKDFSKVVVN